MNKLGAVLIMIGVVGACYLVLLVVIPVLANIIVTANATIVENVADVSAYPGAQSFLVSTPWILFWVPGVVGIAAIILVLRARAS